MHSPCLHVRESWAKKSEDQVPVNSFKRFIPTIYFIIINIENFKTPRIHTIGLNN